MRHNMGDVLILFSLQKLAPFAQETCPIAVYMNVSILDILQGVCSLYSGSILLSNFTWNESDGAGTFVANTLGMLFIVSVQTKITLIAVAMAVTVGNTVFSHSPTGRETLVTSRVVLGVSWAAGALQAILPFM
eukprot:sb/3474857/